MTRLLKGRVVLPLPAPDCHRKLQKWPEVAAATSAQICANSLGGEDAQCGNNRGEGGGWADYRVWGLWPLLAGQGLENWGHWHILSCNLKQTNKLAGLTLNYPLLEVLDNCR